MNERGDFIVKKRIDSYERENDFREYDQKTNPFIILTTEIDITNIYKLCQNKKHYYATMGYYLTKAMNRVEEFKYSYKEGVFYKSDMIHPAFTDIREDNRIGFYTCPLKDDLDDFLTSFDETKKSFLNGTYVRENIDDSTVWLTCQPWYNYSSLVPPFDKNILNPQLVWDKFALKNDRCFINLTIIIHHGFVDGYHIGKFISAINSEIDSIN